VNLVFVVVIFTLVCSGCIVMLPLLPLLLLICCVDLLFVVVIVVIFGVVVLLFGFVCSRYVCTLLFIPVRFVVVTLLP